MHRVDGQEDGGEGSGGAVPGGGGDDGNVCLWILYRQRVSDVSESITLHKAVRVSAPPIHGGSETEYIEVGGVHPEISVENQGIDNEHKGVGAVNQYGVSGRQVIGISPQGVLHTAAGFRPDGLEGGGLIVDDIVNALIIVNRIPE